jgi:hypothetical protein
VRVITTIPQDDLKRVLMAVPEAESQGYNGIVTMENIRITGRRSSTFSTAPLPLPSGVNSAQPEIWRIGAN